MDDRFIFFSKLKNVLLAAKPIPCISLVTSWSLGWVVLSSLGIFSASTVLCYPSHQQGYLPSSWFSSSTDHADRADREGIQGDGYQDRYPTLVQSSSDNFRQDSNKDSLKESTKEEREEKREDLAGVASVPILPRLGHQIQLGLSLAQAQISMGKAGTQASTANSDLYGLFVRYSYHSELLAKLHYFVGTGTEVTAPSQVSSDSFWVSLPNTYNIPSFWIGLVAPSDRSLNLWLSLEYGLRWWNPLSYQFFLIPAEMEYRKPQDVGFKTDDIEVHIQANYFFTPSKALTLGLAREWLIYRPQDGFLGAASEALKIDFSVTSWKLSGGMILSL